MASDGFLELDLDTLQPVNSTDTNFGTVQDTVDEIEIPDNFENTESDSDSFYNEDNDDDLYEISTDSENEELPMYPITNIHMSTVEGDEESDVLIDQDDELSNWIYEQSDQGPLCGHFWQILTLLLKIRIRNLKYTFKHYLMNICGL